MTKKVKVDDLYFKYRPRVTQDAWMVQIWWFQLKSVTGYCADKEKFTDRQLDRRADGRTHACNDNTSPAWKSKG